MRNINNIASWAIFLAVAGAVSGLLSFVSSMFDILFTEVLNGNLANIVAHPIIVAFFVVPPAVSIAIIVRQSRAIADGSFSFKQSIIRTVVYYVFSGVVAAIVLPLMFSNWSLISKNEAGLLVFLLIGTMYLTASTYLWMAVFEFFRRNVGKYPWLQSRAANTVLAVLYGAGGIGSIILVVYVATLRGFFAADTANIVVALGLCVKSVYRTRLLLSN